MNIKEERGFHVAPKERGKLALSFLFSNYEHCGNYRRNISLSGAKGKWERSSNPWFDGREFPRTDETGDIIYTTKAMRKRGFRNRYLEEDWEYAQSIWKFCNFKGVPRIANKQITVTEHTKYGAVKVLFVPSEFYGD